MKKVNAIFLSVLFLTMLIFVGCSDDDPTPTFTLVSLTAGDIDLAGVTAAADVPEDADIVAVFSSDIDAGTASTSTLVITNTTTNEVQSYTINVSGSMATISPENGWDGGAQFSIDLRSTLAGTNGVSFEGNVLTFRTSGIFVPNKSSQVLHLSFDDGTATDETGLQTVTTDGTLNFDTDRRGTANAAAAFDGTGNLVEVAAADALVEGSKTISFWFKTALSDYSGAEGSGHPQTRFLQGLAVERGFFLEVGRRSNDPTSDGFNKIFLKYATNQINVGTNSESVPEATAWTEVNADNSVADFSDETVRSGFDYVIEALQGDPTYISSIVDNSWTHIVMVIDGAAQTKTIYLNGVKTVSFRWKTSGFDWLFGDLSLKDINNDGTPNEAVEGSLALGFAGSKANEGTGWANHATHAGNDAEAKKFFKGALDEYRIFDMAFSDADVEELYNNEK